MYKLMVILFIIRFKDLGYVWRDQNVPTIKFLQSSPLNIDKINLRVFRVVVNDYERIRTHS